MSFFNFSKNTSKIVIFFRKNRIITILTFAIFIVLLYDAIDKLLKNVFSYIIYIPNNFNENVYRLSLALCAVIGIYFAWWRARCYDIQNEIQNENYITDRLIKLYTQLNNNDIAKRIIAIKILWRIATNAKHIDKIAIIDIFNNYINANSKLKYNSSDEVEQNAYDLILIFECLSLYGAKLNIEENYRFNFMKINLCYMQMCSFSFKNSTLYNIDCTGSTFDGSCFYSTIFSKCLFINSSFSETRIRRCVIENSYFKNVRFNNVFFEDTEIENCFFDGCSFDKDAFKKSKIINSNFSNCYYVYCHDFDFDKRFFITTTKPNELEPINPAVFLKGTECHSGISFEQYYQNFPNFRRIIDSKKMIQKSGSNARSIKKRIAIKSRRRLSR